MTTIAEPAERTAATAVGVNDAPTGLRLAYLASRFPKPTETFVLAELEALDDRGIPVDVYPLLDAQHAVEQKGASLWCKFRALFRPAVVPVPAHAIAARWQSRAHYSPLFNGQVFAAQFAVLLRHPLRYLSTLLTLVVTNLTSPRYLAGGLILFPRTVLIARQLQAAGTTHVHAHFANQPAAAAYIVHRLTGIPYSFTAHGSDLHRDQRMLREKVSDAAFVVCISEFNRRFLLQYTGDQFAPHVHVVHCGVDLSVFTARPSRPRGSRLRVLQIGTLHAVKGQRFLLEACAELAGRGIDIECHFAGDGPDGEMLQELSDSLGLTDRVTFHGYCTPGTVRELLATNDVLACPSVPTSDGRREGIPVVLMEAMASEVPVIASDLSGIPELVTHDESGLLVPPGDSAALAAALERVAVDRDLAQKLGEQGRSKVKDEFDRDANVTALVALFERRVASC